MKSFYREIFRTTSITAFSSLIVVCIGIFVTKYIALSLGPIGVGRLGIYQNILALATSIFGLGMSRVAIRQLAIFNKNPKKILLIRQALIVGSIFLGIIGCSIIWALRFYLAETILNAPSEAASIGLLGVALILTLLANSQSSVLTGFRKTSILARVSVLSASIGGCLSIFFIHEMGLSGLIFLIIAGPFITIVIASIFNQIDQPIGWASLSMAEVKDELLFLIRLGSPLMVASAVSLFTMLIARTLVQNILGSDASGLYQATWTISMVYIGFILNAMLTNFYPSLSEKINQKDASCQLVLAQLEMAILLSGPILITIFAFSNQIILLLYDETFIPAAEILKWQTVGDLFKVLCWPLGIVLAAHGRTVLTLFSEIIWGTFYIGSLFITASFLSFEYIGFSFLIAYGILFIILCYVTKLLIGFKLNKFIINYSILIIILISILIIIENNLNYYIYLYTSLIFIILISLYSIYNIIKRCK